jgi:ribulose-phosphate 3-epimerase
MKAGVALNPHTPADTLKDILQDIDLVLVMSVNPGFGGQSFIPHSLQKIREVKRMITERGLHINIQVDGGITLDNAAMIVNAGADVLVAGNTVFSADDPKGVIKKLKALGK